MKTLNLDLRGYDLISLIYALGMMQSVKLFQKDTNNRT